MTGKEAHAQAAAPFTLHCNWDAPNPGWDGRRGIQHTIAARGSCNGPRLAHTRANQEGDPGNSKGPGAEVPAVVIGLPSRHRGRWGPGS